MIVTKHNWQKEVLESNQPVLVDFWSPDCKPCKLMAAYLDRLQQDITTNSKNLKIAKLDIYEDPEIGMEYDVMGFPTLIIYINGGVVDSYQGVGTYNQLSEFVEPYWN